MVRRKVIRRWVLNNLPLRLLDEVTHYPNQSMLLRKTSSISPSPFRPPPFHLLPFEPTSVLQWNSCSICSSHPRSSYILLSWANKASYLKVLFLTKETSSHDHRLLGKREFGLKSMASETSRGIWHRGYKGLDIFASLRCFLSSPRKDIGKLDDGGDPQKK